MGYLGRGRRNGTIDTIRATRERTPCGRPIKPRAGERSGGWVLFDDKIRVTVRSRRVSSNYTHCTRTSCTSTTCTPPHTRQPGSRLSHVIAQTPMWSTAQAPPALSALRQPSHVTRQLGVPTKVSRAHRTSFASASLESTSASLALAAAARVARATSTRRSASAIAASACAWSHAANASASSSGPACVRAM